MNDASKFTLCREVVALGRRIVPARELECQGIKDLQEIEFTLNTDVRGDIWGGRNRLSIFEWEQNTSDSLQYLLIRRFRTFQQNNNEIYFGIKKKKNYKKKIYVSAKQHWIWLIEIRSLQKLYIICLTRPVKLIWNL